MVKVKNRTQRGGQLRIIAGRWRGRKVYFPSVSDLRPTGNRARETLFNWLRPVVVGARCLDMFAGSGALGFEASSQGAAHVLMIENNLHAVAALKENYNTLSATSTSSDIEIIHDDASVWLNKLGLKQVHDLHPFDIVFLDPPFAMEGVSELAAAMEAGNVLAKDCWIYLESPMQRAPSISPIKLPANWRCHRDKTMGMVRYQLYRRHKTVV